ncbi:MAG: anhydro-N-acetylmuramic acid kinase [Bauldia sp.]
MALMTVLGLMSGTSMDGVDAAVVVTDGEEVVSFGPRLFRPYTPAERETLRAAVVEAHWLTDRAARPGALATAERIVTDVHGETVERLMRDNGYARANGSRAARAIDLVGFHGQTVFHAPERRLTVQIGDGRALAERLGIPVVFDFRAADVAAGGEGAPLVPIYHRALAQKARLGGAVAIINIGGVANVTRIAADGSLVAGDTGPGNALIDDFVRARTGAAMDEGGALGARGRVDRQALDRLLDNPWFAKPMPKSLDRDAFSTLPVADLSTEDGAATLTAFTARTVAQGIVVAGGAERIVVVGGGARNPYLMRRVGAAAGIETTSALTLGWSPDFIEAEAFAYLAARSFRGLPITFPGTTGVGMPSSGGVVANP